MSSRLSLENFHERVVLDTFAGQTLNDQDFFLIFCLLHNYKIAVVPDALDFTGTTIFALTQRGAAAVLGGLWTATLGNESVDNSASEADYLFWYSKWNTDWNGYDHFDNLTDDELSSLMLLRKQLEQHPLIEEISPEDDVD